MCNLLDRFVASPQSAIMLLQDDPGADVIKVTITSKEAGTRIKDMKLPDDIQVLSNPNANPNPDPSLNLDPNPNLAMCRCSPSSAARYPSCLTATQNYRTPMR